MRHLFKILFVACALWTNAQESILEGDLLFAYSATSGLAISQATVHETTALPIYHVAIATWVGEKLYALEAIDEGVVLTPYEKFVERTRSKGGMLVGRLRDRSGASQSVSNAMEHIGKPYDRILHAGRKTHAENLAENGAVNPQLSELKAVDRALSGELPQTEQRGRSLRNGGGNGRPADVQTGYAHEKPIEKDIQHRGKEQII